jgi:hypothetical protein
VAYALVSGQFAKAAGTAVSSVNVVLPNNPATGNLVVVTCATSNTSGTFSCADSNSNTYSLTPKTPFYANSQACCIFYLIAPANATKTITVTFPAAAGGDVFAAEFSGGALSSILEGDNSASQSSGVTGPVTSPTMTTVNNGDLLIGACTITTSLSSANAPWTGWPSGIGTNQNYAEYFIQTSAGAQAIAFTANSAWAATSLIAAFIVAPTQAVIGKPRGTLFAPGKKRGPVRGLRPTQAFPGPVGSIQAMAASSIIILQGTLTPKGTASLSTKSLAAITGRPAPSGKAAMVAKGLTATLGKSTITGKAALQARGSTGIAGKSTLTGTAAMSARGLTVVTRSVSGIPGPQASAFLARTSGLSPLETAAYVNLINGLVSDGLWSLLDVLYIFATNTQTTALLNLVSTSYAGTAHGTVNFTADQGYTGDGSTFYIDTGWKSTNGPNFVQNSAAFGCYILITGGATEVAMGQSVSWYDVLFYPQQTLGNLGASITSTSPGALAAVNASDVGQWSVLRTGASSSAVYKNGSATPFATSADGSKAPSANNLFIFALNNGSPSNFYGGQIAAAWTGGGMTQANTLAVQSHINDYMGALGIQVYGTPNPPTSTGPDLTGRAAMTASSKVAMLSQSSLSLISNLLAMTARSLLTITGRPSLTGRAALQTSSFARITGTPSLIGRAAMTARGFTATFGRSSLVSKVFLSALSSIVLTGRTSLAGTAAMSARSLTRLASTPSLTGRLALSASSKIMTAGQSTMSVLIKVILATASLIALTGRGSLTGRAALSTQTRTALTGRTSLTGSLVLAARTIATLTGRASLVFGAIPLAARSLITLVGKGAMTGRLALSARTGIGLTGPATFSGRLALSARTLMTIVTRSPIVSSLFLGARSLVSLAARTAPAFTANLTARSLIQTTGSVTLAGRLALSASTRIATTGVTTLARNLVMSARSLVSLTGRLPFTGRASLAASSQVSTTGLSSLTGRLALTARSSIAVASRTFIIPRLWIQASGRIMLSGLATFRLVASTILRADIRFVSYEDVRQTLTLDNLRSLFSPMLARLFSSIPDTRVVASVQANRRQATTLEVPVPQGPDFSIMDVGEIVTGGIDFGRWLGPSESITSVSSVIVENYNPSIGAAFITLVGSSQIGTIPTAQGGSGTVNAAVLQQWQGTNPGTARVTITVVTSANQTLKGWAHQPVGSPS